jgi:hypothetical protein
MRTLKTPLTASMMSTVARMTPVPVLLRVLAGGAAFAALLVAVPTDSVSPGLVAVLMLPAVVVATAPRTRWVGLVMLGCAAAWIVAGVAYGDEATPLRIGALGGLMYVLHVAAAFAAVVPLDCVVAPGVVARWVGRQAVVLAIGLAVGLGGMTVAGLVPVTPTLVGPVLGAAVAAGTAGVLAWLLRRR